MVAQVFEGTVCKLVRDRGFGFIRQKGEMTDIFFHASGLVDVPFDELEEGEIVTFEVVPDAKGSGKRAVAIQLKG